MGQMVNKVLLAGDKCMPKMHLIQHEFTDSTCGRFTKHREGIQKLMQTGNLKQL